MSMIKISIPLSQKFSSLPSAVFFIVEGDKDTLYQTIIPINVGTKEYNAVALYQTASGQRGHTYSFRMTTIDPNTEIQRVEVVDIDVLISSHIDS